MYNRRDKKNGGKATCSIKQTPSLQPSKYQIEKQKNWFGMFIHFGVNTFNNTEWSDGKLPVSSYTPTQIDTDDWARTAYLAGMHYGGKTYKYNTRDV